MDNILKVGILGLGRIGKLHVKTITTYFRSLISIEAVSDPFIQIDKEWAKENGIGKIYDNYIDVINDSDVEAVLICTSTDTHAMLIEETAKAKKHIFCEKPIDYDPEKINKALNKVKENGVKLQIGFNRRFDHNFVKIKEFINKKKIGDLHTLKITSRDPWPPPIVYVKVSGGIYLDMSIHDYDMIRFLTGSEVDEVYAMGNIRINPEIAQYGDVDTLVIMLMLTNGAIAVIDNSRQAVHGFDQRGEAFGSKGCAMVSNDYPDNAVLYTEEGTLSGKPLNFFMDRYANTYVDELKAFVECIKYDKEPVVSGLDGLKPVLIGLAVKKSLESNKPIKVEE